MLYSIFEHSGPTRPRCPIARFKYDNPELAEELDEAISATNPGGDFVVTAIAFTNYMNDKYGTTMRVEATRAHRRRDCACP